MFVIVTTTKKERKKFKSIVLKCWDTHKHKDPTQFFFFLGIHAWALYRSVLATEKQTMVHFWQGASSFVFGLFVFFKPPQ